MFGNVRFHRFEQVESASHPFEFCHTRNMIAGDGSRKWWIIGFAVAGVLLLAVAGWKFRPAYQHYKEQRSLRLAQEFFAKGDYRNGLLSLRQTLALNPDNAAAVTLMADFTAQAQSPAALGWWQRVVALAPTRQTVVAPS